ncbi:YadA-like family protein [Pseudomonas fluorescens]|nr:YadA-like family protein [Pseudomonas fluorescens]
MTSVGVGNFQGESTVAVGVATMSKDGKWVTKLQGSTDSQGEIGYRWAGTISQWADGRFR